MMFTEDYSYLLVAFFTVIFSLYLTARYMGFTYEIQLSKLLASSLLIVTSITLYFTSFYDVEYGLQLKGTSFSLMVTGLLLLVFKPLSYSDLIPLITPFFMVPVPATIMDNVTSWLSKFIGKLVAIVTGVEYVETPAYSMLRLTVNGQQYTFSVEAACSGIVTLSSITVLFPLLLYFVSITREPVSRKLVVSVKALLAGLLIGFLGNLLRVLLIIIVAKHYNVELAYTVFHYSPSVIYSALSVLVCYTVISRSTDLRFIVPRPLQREASLIDIKWNCVTGVLLILLVVVGATTTSVVLSMSSTTTRESENVVKVNNVSEFIGNPLSYVFNNTSWYEGVYDDFLTRVIGAIAVYRIKLVVNGVLYQGFLEIVDIPAKLHTLQLCMSLQGFKVNSAWSRVNGEKLVYILSEKNNAQYILGYALAPILIETQSGERYTLYLRVSLFKLYENSNDIDEITQALLSMVNRVKAFNSTITQLVDLNALSLFNLLFTGMFLSYTVALVTYSVFKKKRSG